MAGQMLVRASGPAAGPPGCSLERDGLAKAAHVVDRDDDLEFERLAHPGVDDGHRPRWPGGGRGAGLAPAQVGGDRLQRALRGGQADALRRRAGQRVEALQRQGQVGAALGAGQRVDLVHDDPFHAAQRLACLGGQDEEERLGRRDQDVRRVLAEGPPFLGRRVARAHAHPDVRLGQAQALGRQRQAVERRPQVALDVMDERLERRDVQHAQRRERVGRRRLGPQAVQAPQERGQRLARAGRRADQRVTAGRDGRPALGLGGRRRPERAAEPRLRGRAEQVQGVGRGRLVDGKRIGSWARAASIGRPR